MLETKQMMVRRAGSRNFYNVPPTTNVGGYRLAGYEVVELVDLADVVAQQQALVDALAEFICGMAGAPLHVQ